MNDSALTAAAREVIKICAHTFPETSNSPLKPSSISTAFIEPNTVLAEFSTRFSQSISNFLDTAQSMNADVFPFFGRHETNMYSFVDLPVWFTPWEFTIKLRV